MRPRKAVPGCSATTSRIRRIQENPMRFAVTKRALPALIGTTLLAACVSEQKYDELQQAYQQLQSRYSADEATIQMLQGRLKVTMTDRILFPSGGWRITESARQQLAKMVPTLQGLTQTR